MCVCGGWSGSREGAGEWTLYVPHTAQASAKEAGVGNSVSSCGKSHSMVVLHDLVFQGQKRGVGRNTEVQEPGMEALPGTWDMQHPGRTRNVHPSTYAERLQSTASQTSRDSDCLSIYLGCTLKFRVNTSMRNGLSSVSLSPLELAHGSHGWALFL